MISTYLKLIKYAPAARFLIVQFTSTCGKIYSICFVICCLWYNMHCIPHCCKQYIRIIFREWYSRLFH